ncbi:non-ribosomal peptide synthetase, partial [Serratia rubidaea]|uniref:non-ribosomal peptide synthetase n=1 Tax=Serratia rubidaea TaxID=61652 RepID=UPI00177DA240
PGRSAGVGELLAAVREQVLAAQAHQALPFDQVVEALQPPRSLAYTPLFQVMFDWQNAPEGELNLTGLTAEMQETPLTSAQCDLTLSLEERDGEVCGLLNYATALFERASVERMAGYLRQVLAGMAAETPVARLPLLDAAQRRHLLSTLGGCDDALTPQSDTLHRLFEAQAAQRPTATALSTPTGTLSYGELNARANRLARHLQAQGVGPGARVALCLGRSAEMVTAILAVLKAGGGYVPLDPAYSSARLAETLADSEPQALLLDDEGRQALADTDLRACGVVRDMRRDRARWAAEPEENLAEGGAAGDLAYVIYTSGSTGKPKGVMVEHGNVTRLFSATGRWFGFNAQDVWTLFHSYSFDFSVWELWGALLHGGRLVVVPTAVSREPAAFYRLLCREGVTVLNQTPEAFRPLIAAQGVSDEAHRLRHIIFGGEALEARMLQPWFARHHERQPQLTNMYGITETTVHVTYYPLRAADAAGRERSAVGERIPDLRLYVLDAQREPTPYGVSGELYVGGAGVARGYLNRPALTAERFIADPFAEGGRLYRTGDLGRWQADGTLEYLGRNDAQVKLRGFRIEPGEIEAQLAQVAGVREVVVVLREDSPGDRRLAAYYTGEALEAGQLRREAEARLPEYMVPAAYVHLAALPLTAN